MDFRCGMNNLFVHLCKIKHIWNEFCLLFGFKESNHSNNSTSAKAILKRGLSNFREYRLVFSVGQRNHKPAPLHIPEVTQACNATLICCFVLWGEGNSFHRLSVN